MYLAALKVRDFRKLRKAELKFHPTLNVIVGENNGGKTAVIDAICTGLLHRQADLFDLAYTPTAPPDQRYCASAEVDALFTGLSKADEAIFIDALVRGANRGQYDARLRVTVTLHAGEVQRDFQVGDVGRSGNPYDVLRGRRVVYLPPLRDPDSATGLRPGRQSQLAHLLRRTAFDDTRRSALEGIATQANADLKATDAVRDARELLWQNLVSLSGPDYALPPELGFVEPEFDRIAGNLEAMAAGMQISMNGLGSSNLYYVAAVLADLAKDKSVRYRCLIIEEPEAHLHPHYQVLLLRFLQHTAANADHPVQVFVTTHSPILASQAAHEGLLPLVEHDDGRHVASPIAFGGDRQRSTKIRQYLDATRSELFFARRLIMVEGDGELLLFPELAAHLGVNLAQRGVSVVSAAGLNFKVFLPFVRSDVLNIPVALVTDSDPDTEHEDAAGELVPSPYLQSLRAEVGDDAKVQIFASDRTLEYDIALPQLNRAYLLEAMRRLHPRKVRRFETQRPNDETDDHFAGAFHAFFFGPDGKPASKADFAMELALMLKGGDAPQFVVPPYLRRAITHVTPAVRN